MTSYIKGTLAAVNGSETIIETGALGIVVKTSRAVIERPPTKGVELLLHTCLKMSGDAASLYDFDREVDLCLFRALLGVSNIGPRRAPAALSALEPEALKLTVLTGDAKAITKVPGIGARTTGRTILKLKGQEAVQTLSANTISGGGVSGAAAVGTIGALIQLGYGIGNAARAVRTVPEVGEKGGETLLWEALWQF